MLWVLLAMLLILAVAALVAVYVAFPHRGRDLPAAPGVGVRLRRAVDALPTLDPDRR